MKRKKRFKKKPDKTPAPRNKKMEILTIVIIILITLFGLISAYLMFNDVSGS